MQTPSVGIGSRNRSRPVRSVRRVGRTMEGHCGDRVVCAVLVYGQLRSWRRVRWCRVRVRWYRVCVRVRACVRAFGVGCVCVRWCRMRVRVRAFSVGCVRVPWCCLRVNAHAQPW